MSARAIILHVGPHKTGSTAIQVTLSENRPVLRSGGFTYPEIGYEGVGHHDLAKALLAGPSKRLDEMIGAINALDGDLILSSEDLSMARVDQLRIFFSRIEFKEVRVVFYLRSFLPQLFSFWQEETKHGRHRTFLEFCATYLMQPFASHTLNPQRLLNEFAGFFGRDAITIYRYDRIMGAQGDVARHFMQEVLGIADYATPKNGEVHNKGLALGPVELVRRLNSQGLDGWQLIMSDPQLRQLLVPLAQKSGPFEGAMPLNYDMFLFAYLERELIEHWGDKIVGFDRSEPHLFEERTHVARFLRTEIWAEESALNQAFQMYVERRRATANVPKLGAR